MEHLRIFETETEYNENLNLMKLEYPTVSYVEELDRYFYFEEPDCSQQYLTFVAQETGTFTLSVPAYINSDLMTSVSYSIDKGSNWTTTQINGTAQTITTPTINAGDSVLWKGEGIAISTDRYSSVFSSTGNFIVLGNIMSLFYDDDFVEETSFVDGGNYNLKNAFNSATYLTSAKYLVLPATELKRDCYNGMFQGCTSLTTAPSVLPAEELAMYCYSHMFDGCTSLTTAPELPASVVEYYSCEYMFNDCTSLTTAPELPATTLEQGCYSNMFSGCTSLTTVPSDMLPATELAIYCYSNMFNGCTSLTMSPELPAFTLISGCYYRMFRSCSNLKNIKALFTTTPSNTYTSEWILGVPQNTGTFLRCAGATWSISSGSGYGTPSGWTVTEYWPEDYDYFTTEAINDSVFTLTIGSSVPVSTLKYVEYSLDNGETWTKTDNVASTTVTVTTPTIAAGDSVKWRCAGGGTAVSNTSNYISTFSSTDEYRISGKLQSLAGANTDGCGVFCALFKNSTNLMSVEDLILSESVSAYCYEAMFNGCTSITTSPVLPAQDTTNKNYCYRGMFQGCSSLTHITTLVVNLASSNDTVNWVSGVAASGTFVVSGASKWNTTGVNGIPSGWTVTEYWPEDYDYFTTEAIDDTVFTFAIGTDISTSNLKYVEYSLDDGETWTKTDNVASTTVTVTTPTIAAGDSVKWRCAGTQLSALSVSTTYPSAAKISQFSSTGNFNVYGNTASLLGCTKYKTSIGIYNSIAALFYNAQTLVSAENLKLPPAIAEIKCLFYNCSSLTVAPKIRTNNVGNYCLGAVFYNCTSLTTVPKMVISGYNSSDSHVYEYGCTNMFRGCTNLKDISNVIVRGAMTGKNSCQNMFDGCTSLTTVPYNLLDHNSKTLVEYCYTYMFRNCSSLTMAPDLPATTLAQYCYQFMFYGCTALTTAPTISATTLGTYCCEYMFHSCTSLTTATKLPATTLVNYCYSNMFYGCTALTTVPSDMLPATTLANGCYSNMFYGCTALTTVPSNMLPATSLKPSCYEAMFKGCTNLTTSPTLLATSYDSYCYSHMFDGTDALPDCTNINFNTSSSATMGLFAGTKVTYNDLLTILPLNGDNKPYLPPTSLITYAYVEMFQNCTSLVTPPVLPATSLANRCYYYMFDGCTSLTTVPELPATVLYSYCYDYMFRNCTSLTTIPSNLLSSVTSLATYCCAVMFQGCTNLTTTLVLPSLTTAPSNCYTNMFGGCTSLTTAPVLPATTLGSCCYASMFKGCTSLTTVPVLPATSLPNQSGQTGCYQDMFNGCTSLTTVPSNMLPATTLNAYCYKGMFSGCTSLTTAPVLPATTFSTYSCNEMFRGCTSLTTAPTISATTLGTYCCQSMFYGCTSLTTVPVLPATTLQNNCYQYMFQNCTSLTTIPSNMLPATTLTSNCYASMFRGCNKLTTAPDLLATTLVSSCYGYMFYGCSQINYVKALFTTTPSNTYTNNWLYGVKSTGTFVKNSTATWTNRGTNAVPNNWTIETAAS